MNKELKSIYSKLITRKTLRELSEGLERVNIRMENGVIFDVFLHYSDNSIRWIEGEMK